MNSMRLGRVFLQRYYKNMIFQTTKRFESGGSHQHSAVSLVVSGTDECKETSVSEESDSYFKHKHFKNEEDWEESLQRRFPYKTIQFQSVQENHSILKITLTVRNEHLRHVKERTNSTRLYSALRVGDFLFNHLIFAVFHYRNTNPVSKENNVSKSFNLRFRLFGVCQKKKKESLKQYFFVMATNKQNPKQYMYVLGNFWKFLEMQYIKLFFFLRQTFAERSTARVAKVSNRRVGA
ncbi:hypothetical protein RFI_09435 [Reticulomyxa filosa]|uniref:Uncharacterized protein n=1 Tax=Reticulomyxa filosa TaxID=46433 RepID=X6NQR0_RETFI|nr:hypothetical protein RFI_09435 [Reticulomyxa filosa]|eukprot:ETO27697.1 hypothetical protein RFI_09435 [Reticulomyxa filosa]